MQQNKRPNEENAFLESNSCSASEQIPVHLIFFAGYFITRPPLWSSGRVRFPALPEKKVVGLERGPLSLVSTTEELLDRKVATPV
jgi:hypothetical protein